jgi:thioredoxin 1
MSQKFQEIINSEKPVLIDFFATWCQPCRVQSSVLVTVKEQVGDAARIIKIDIDQYPAIASEYNVRGSYSSDFQKRTITMERKRRA